MNKFYTRLLRLIFGLFLYAVGIVITLNANIGYAPWDVFHVGIAKMTGLSIGNASIIVGALICIITVLLGEKLGLGTILNMFLIGIFLDLILKLQLIPIATHMLTGIVMVIIGLFVIAFASYFYMGSAFGAGPRDSLMVAITRKTGLPIGLCRGAIEIMAVVVGWKLGGMVGIGTIISALLVGVCVQTTFKLLHFDTTTIEHETLNRTYQVLFANKNKAFEREEL